MGLSVQVPALGDRVGVGDAVGDPVGDPVGDEVGDDVGVGEGFGSPTTTLPPGWGEGRFPIGGLGLVAGASGWPSFWQAIVARSRREKVAAALAGARWGRVLIGVVGV